MVRVAPPRVARAVVEARAVRERRERAAAADANMVD